MDKKLYNKILKTCRELPSDMTQRQVEMVNLINDLSGYDRLKRLTADDNLFYWTHPEEKDKMIKELRASRRQLIKEAVENNGSYLREIFE